MILTLPLAMGRYFFSGWNLSRFLSKISFKIYTLEQIRLKAIKAMARFKALLKSSKAKNAGAKIKIFFAY